MVRWPQKSSQEDTVSWAASEQKQPASFFRLYCVVVTWSPEVHVTGLIWGVCVITVSGGLSSSMWLRAGPCPSLHGQKTGQGASGPRGLPGDC